MNNDLGQKITAFSVFKFTIPTMLMLVVMAFYTIVDGIFVARLIGTNAFSAVNIIYPLLSLVIGLGTMFGTGLSALVSKKLGEKKEHEARQNISFVVIVTSIFGLLLTTLCLVFLEKIIYLLGSNAEIYDYCYDYAKPLIFFFVAYILQFQFINLYVANGKPHIGLIVTIIGGLSNIILDYVFIAKCNMGIAGAAIATGIGYSIPTLYGLYHFSTKRKANLFFVKAKADWRMLWKTMTNGSSEMVSYLSTSLTTFLFNIIMMRLLGQNGVAAIAILLYLDFILVAVSLGYSMGVAPLFSYNHGSQNEVKLKKLYKLSLGLCASFSIAITFITFVFSDNLASVFANKGTEVYKLASVGLSIYAFSYLFKGFNIFSSALFTAFGNGRVSALLSFMRTLVFLALSLLTLSTLYGVQGVWFAVPLSESLAFIICLAFSLKFRKKYHY